MIIKSNRKKPPAPSPSLTVATASPTSDSLSAFPEYSVPPVAPALAPPPPPEPEPEWSADAVASGDMPERRARPSENERRQGFRRLEDRELISRAQEEADGIRAVAHEQGFQAGLDDAQSVIDDLREGIERLTAVEQEALLQMATRILPMAVTIAEKIIRTEVSADPELIVALAQDLIKRSDPSQKQIVFKVNPVDATVLQDAITSDPTWTFNDRQVLVQGDETVDMGGALLETPSGMIDGSLKTQLEVVRRLLGLQG